jgi:DNA-binding response OmpR family regulator
LQEASDLLLEPGRYAALLLDLKLPDGDGVGLIHALRGRDETCDLPIIVVSAYVDEGREATKALSLNLVDWLEKPVDVDRLRSVVAAAVARAAPTGRQPAILHVDDDPDILRVTAAALTGLGRIISVDSLAAARAVLAGQRPDLVILDIGLGDGSGLELLPDLDEFEDDIPVVVFSAQDTDPTLLRRVDEVLVKSRSSVASLTRTVRRLVRSSQARQP